MVQQKAKLSLDSYLADKQNVLSRFVDLQEALGLEDLPERPVRDPRRSAWRGRMLIHAGSCAIAVLLVLGLAVDGERVPNGVRP